MHPSHRSFRLSITAVLLLAFAGGCSTPSQPQASTSVTTTAVSSPTANPSPKVAASAQPNAAPTAWQQAMEHAGIAANLAQVAQSKDDWSLVSRRWEQAIAQLTRIPAGTAQYAQAQGKMTEYRRNLQVAQQRANSPIPEPTTRQSTVATNPSPSPAAASARSNSAAPNTSAEVALAMHLRSSGARMYGTYWCGYCNRQRQMFGQEAVNQLEIIECDPRGSGARPDLCQAANVASFPTWEINGQLYRGLQPLERLAELSGYRGSQNFGS